MRVFYWVMGILIVGTFLPSVFYMVLFAVHRRARLRHARARPVEHLAGAGAAGRQHPDLGPRGGRALADLVRPSGLSISRTLPPSGPGATSKTMRTPVRKLTAWPASVRGSMRARSRRERAACRNGGVSPGSSTIVMACARPSGPNSTRAQTDTSYGRVTACASTTPNSPNVSHSAAAHFIGTPAPARPGACASGAWNSTPMRKPPSAPG
jgi:hypothetical protein